MAVIPQAPPPPYAPGPAVHGFAVTPSDATVFATPTRFLWVGGAGNIAVMLTGDAASVILTNVPAGTALEISVTQVLATGTTASAVVGLY